MRADVLSPSAMEQYEACSKQFWYARESSQEPLPSTAAQVGSCFHQAMEFYVQQHYRFDFDYAMEWSLANGEYFRNHISTEALHIGRAWIARNQRYLPQPMTLNGQNFPQAEMPFGPPGDTVHTTKVPPGNAVVFPDTGLRVHGLVDMIHPHWDQRLKQWIFVVTDWKTNRKVFGNAEFKKQSQVYALAVHKITGWPVRVDYWFVRYPGLGPLSWQPDVSEFPQIERNLAVLQEAIKGNNKPIEQPSEDCRWCDFNYTCGPFQNWAETTGCDSCVAAAEKAGKIPPRRCKHLVPIWQKQEIEELAEQYIQMRGRALATDWIRKKMGQVLIEKMDQAGISTVLNMEIKDFHDYEYDDTAIAEIERWGGKEYMPDQLYNEIELYHKRRVPKATYLRVN